MATELPYDLTPELAPLSWLIGSWEGQGRLGDGTEGTEIFYQRVDFAEHGLPFLEYRAESWLCSATTPTRVVEPWTGERSGMTRLLMLTRAARAVEVLPALDLLTHEVRVAQPRAALVPAHPDVEAVLLDATAALADARTVARDVSTLCPQVPVLAVLTEGALTAVGPEWSLADVVLASAGPAEVDARIRLLRVPGAGPGPAPDDRPLTAGGLEVDAAGYRARVDGRSLNLTFREFELLKHLVQSPGRVFTREQLLQEVWGYDYFGGTRTVDVHVRRLRAKLGADHEQLIVTVRNVGYRFAPRGDAGEAAAGSPT